MIDKLKGDIKRALSNRYDLTKKNIPEGHLVGHVDSIKKLTKEITKQLEPLKDAMIVLKGYLKEVEARLSDSKQLSIFDINEKTADA